MSKSLFKSKSFWFNVAAGAVHVAQGALGFNLPPHVAAGVVLGGNIVLRLMTEDPVHVLPR